MKSYYNPKYLTIALYCFLVLIGAILFFLVVQNFSSFVEYFNYLTSISSPFVYGFVFAFLLNPLLKFFEVKLIKKHLALPLTGIAIRGISIFFTYISAAIILSVFFWIVIPEVTHSIASIVADSSDYIREIEEFFAYIYSQIPGDLPSELIDTITELFTEFSNMIYSVILNAGPTLLNYAFVISSGIFSIVLGLIISVYFLLNKETFFAQLKKMMCAFFPSRTVNFVVDLTHESNQIFTGFIVGKIIDSFIIGILCFFGLTLINVPNVLLISLVIGITNIIPYFGPFIGGVPCFFIVLIEDPSKALLYAVFIFLLQQFDGNILGPKILGDSIGLSAFWVIFSIMVFSSLLGVVGMFIGVPTFAVIYSAIRKFVNYRLEKKNLPTETALYASSEHPILIENKPIKKKNGVKKPTE